MARSVKERKKAKRKAKRKQLKAARSREALKERSEFLLDDAVYFREIGNLDKAVASIRKAHKLRPNDVDILMEMGNLGSITENSEMELKAMTGLHEAGALPDELRLSMLYRLVDAEKYEEGISFAEETIELFPKLKIKDKRETKKEVNRLKEYCEIRLKYQEIMAEAVKPAKRKTVAKPKKKTERKPEKAAADARPSPPLEPSGAKRSSDLPQKIPVSVELDTDSFRESLLHGKSSGLLRYELALEGYQIRFKESFENLICLGRLSNVRSLWYQEETARKVLKQFRGRALLSDEVGLGKTIEALIIFSEYIQRGMVKTGLILTPTTLVSQWKDEMMSKFGIDIPSTDDPDFKSKGKEFWDSPFILASINQAKSKKNFDAVTGREYDIVIVDEAHHLKNRTTLNWKLVNALKKRFILLLTATPVENNLMELYNLITLLKPGQLKTASAFREEFMTRGDPTDPRNRTRLKDLLGQVMIRNTRSLAGIKIPPRFAETIRIKSSKTEKALYDKIQALVKDMTKIRGGRGKLLLKNLLAQAGSSPKALELTISRMLEKNDYLLEQERQIRAVHNLCRTTVDTQKNKMLLKLIKSTSDKIIIFVKYRGTMEHLEEFLSWEGIPHALFHGQMDNARKDREILSFREEKKVLVTTEIGGEGRNLQFCHQMINYDLPWNPMKLEQRIGRIHRIGQENEVKIYNFCAAGSVEDYILEILDKKINMFEMVIGEIDMIIGRIRGEKDFSDIVYDIWVNAESETERKKSFNNLGARLKRAKTGYEKTRAFDDKLFGESYEL